MKDRIEVQNIWSVRGVVLLGVFFSLLLLPSFAGAEQDASPPLDIKGTAAILGDIDSATVLFSQDPDKHLPPASLTKIMTLYLTYEALAHGDLQLDMRLPVSEKAWRMGGSKTFVRVDDKVRVEDLIRGIAVQSGNDACLVIAEHISGSEEAFATLMNNKAKALGMVNSHFVNVSGMPDPDHYTTARDLFILARSLMVDYPQYAGYSREKQYTFNGIRQYNRNRLLWRDPSVTGLKTGHTRDAGYCLIATNENEGQRLAAVIMGAQGSKIREREALRLLRYGNRAFETVRLFDAKAVVRKLRIWKGKTEHIDATVTKPLFVTISRKQRGSLEVGLLYDEPLLAPIPAGKPIGTIVVKLDGKEITTRPVVAATEVPSGGFFGNLIDSTRLSLGW